jgi:ribosomal protein L22
MKRQMPRAFGRASQILKKCSHIVIELGDITNTQK